MAFFSTFFDKKESKALGIDIGSSAIKIVELKKKNGQAILTTYGELALGPYAGFTVGQAVSLPPEKIAQALTDLMNEKEVNISTKKCGLSIPFASSLMSVIEMPEVSAKQLSVMVPLEARKYIPVPISEVALDWSVIPKSEVRETTEYATAEDSSATQNDHGVISRIPKIDVLVVAIHNETIARYQEIVTKSALEASFFEIEIFATCRAVLDEVLAPVMIMDIGAASTKLYVVERGIIRTSHTVNRGSQDITAALSKSLGITLAEAEVMKRQVGMVGKETSANSVIALVLDYIFGETNTTLLSFEKKYNKTISKVILVGGGSVAAAVAAATAVAAAVRPSRASPI